MTVVIAVVELAFAATAESAPPHGATSQIAYDNSQIVHVALRYVGRWGGLAWKDAGHDASGQCKQFVNCVVFLASGGHQYPVDRGGDYQLSYSQSGGRRVQRGGAISGDIIQIGSRDYEQPLHTAIVLSNHHDGAFTVVDANWVGSPDTPELVGVHNWNPPSAAEFWRLGSAHDALITDVPEAARIRTLPAPSVHVETSGASLRAASTVAPATASARFYLDGKPLATVAALAGHAVIGIPGNLLPGSHTIAAQTITEDGALSPLSTPVALPAAASPDDPKQQDAIAAKPAATPTDELSLAVSGAPLVSGSVPVTIRTTHTTRLHGLGLHMDGIPATATVSPDQSSILWDSSTLVPGVHVLTVQAANNAGTTITSEPVDVTVAAYALANRVALDTTGTGRKDLIGIDSSGRLLLYAGTDTGFAPGGVLSIDPVFRHPHALLAGTFTAPGQPQLLAVADDGAAQLYTIDMPGHLTPPMSLARDAHLNRYVHIASGNFDGSGRSQLLGITADGRANLLDIAVGDQHIAVTPAGLAPAGRTAAWITATDVAGTGTEALLAIAPDGTITAQWLLPSRRLGPTIALGRIDARDIADQPVASQFGTDPLPELLFTRHQGSTSGIDKAQWNDGR